MSDTNKTERLYYSDSHLTEFEARVTSVTTTEDGRTAVTLDRTAFYPTGGGQPHDTGTLGEARIVDCINQEDEVFHIIEEQIPQKDQTVVGNVDWPRRLDHIQQHTGQHILSRVFVELFRAETHGFRLLERYSEIDVQLDDPSDERIEQAVGEANRIIWQNRLVRIHHNITAEAAARLPLLRQRFAREGSMRIIEIEDFDMNPCGGTHARQTGEVGLIAVRSWERAKGMTRLEFVAGERALTDYKEVNRTARSIARVFSVGRDEATASVLRLVEEHKSLSRRVRSLEEAGARVEADALLAAAMPDASGLRIIAHTFTDRDADALKFLANQIAAHPRSIALLGTTVGAGNEAMARLVFARAADAPGDMNLLMREACLMVEGRGGGRPDLAQGGGPRVEQLQAAIQHALSLLPK
ncbi:MAG: hypothetical protein H0T92_18285 [Pyrinomonadaceae bacterium]|nr:hypothetical protein [Pyrinomonadaceae bacterium]